MKTFYHYKLCVGLFHVGGYLYVKVFCYDTSKSMDSNRSIDFNWVIFNAAEKKVAFVSISHHFVLSEPHVVRLLLLFFNNIRCVIIRITGKVGCVDDNEKIKK